MISRALAFPAAALLAVLALTQVAPATGATRPVAAAPTVDAIASTVETDPVANRGDAADDPAIWVHPTDVRKSMVIGNNKAGALETYGLDGSRLQRITGGSAMYGNVDVRGNLVVVGGGQLRAYNVNAATRQLSTATEADGGIRANGEGLCLYDPGATGIAGGLYAFTITRAQGRVTEYSLLDADRDGLITGAAVRQFTLGSEAEGCVANDETGDLFIAEEGVAVWRYGAEPAAGTGRTRVAAVGGSLPADAEGLTLAADLLLVSAQNVAAPQQNFIAVYTAGTPYSLVGRFRVVAGGDSDDCDRTDGIAAYAGSLAPAFPTGLLVCQDGDNGAPGTAGNQNFKLAPLDPVLQLRSGVGHEPTRHRIGRHPR